MSPDVAVMLCRLWFFRATCFSCCFSIVVTVVWLVLRLVDGLSDGHWKMTSHSKVVVVWWVGYRLTMRDRDVGGMMSHEL